MQRRHLIVTGLVVALVITMALILASCGGGTTTTTAAETTTTAAMTTTTMSGASTTAAAIDAAALYAANCQGCHQTMPTGSVADVQSTIESGTGNMPSFSDKLSADEIAALAAYVAGGGQ
jgi:mono/diheme cytochrome c family protein